MAGMRNFNGKFLALFYMICSHWLNGFLSCYDADTKSDVVYTNKYYIKYINLLMIYLYIKYVNKTSTFSIIFWSFMCTCRFQSNGSGQATYEQRNINCPCRRKGQCSTCWNFLQVKHNEELLIWKLFQWNILILLIAKHRKDKKSCQHLLCIQQMNHCKHNQQPFLSNLEKHSLQFQQFDQCPL